MTCPKCKSERVAFDKVGESLGDILLKWECYKCGNVWTEFVDKNDESYFEWNADDQ